MSSMDNLKNAFAGESQANRKYLAFAKKAEEEGFKQVAKALPCNGRGRSSARAQPSAGDGRRKEHKRKYSGGSWRRNVRIYKDVSSDDRGSQKGRKTNRRSRALNLPTRWKRYMRNFIKRH